MSYYNICEHCGSNLDPGEKCDCMEQQVKENIFFMPLMPTMSLTPLMPTMPNK